MLQATPVALSAPAQPPSANAASVEVPNLAADTERLGNENKFFIFHRPGTTFAEAAADFRFCFRYVHQGMWEAPPAFVPWSEGNGLKQREPTYSFGLIGGLMGAAVQGGLERSIRQINLTSCMLPRGYNRYRISAGMWRELNGKDLEQSILVQAKIASGPVPSTPRVLP